MDRGLVERARDGDREAYELLARSVGRPLCRVAHRILRDLDAAEDAVQRALVGIWRDLPRLRDLDRFDASLSASTTAPGSTGRAPSVA